MSYGGGGGIPFPGSQQSFPGSQQYVNPNAPYGAPPVQYGGQMPQMSQMSQMPQMGAMPSSMPTTTAAADPYANAQPGTIAYAKSEGPDGIATYTPVIAQETFYQTPSGPTRGIKWVTATSSQASAAGIPSGAITATNAAQLPQTAGMMPPITMPPGGIPPSGYIAASPADDYPVMKPGMSQREYDKVVKRWEKDREKDRQRAEKRARKEKERKRDHRDRDRDPWDPRDAARDPRDPQDPYDITGGRPRRMSVGGGIVGGGFERARRMSGGAALREDDLSRKLESLDMSFNSRRERRMSGGGGGGYAPSTMGARSRRGSVSEAGRPGGYYSRSRHASPSMPPAHLPGGYGGSTYGGARDPTSASAYPAYGADARTPYSTVSNLPPTNDSYALTRRPAGGAPSSLYPVPGRELNRAQPFTAFEEFFLVEDLRELMQPQPPPLPAALVPHDVMAEEWDRCMQGLISQTSQALQSSRSSALDPLIELITQWNTTFFLPRGVDISVYKGNSRRSGPPMNHPSTLRAYDESESESESSSSSSTSSSESEEDRYFSSARREQKAARRAERKARRKERHRRRRARRRQRSASIRIRAVPIN
ncbi:hypothetical protein FRC11_004204 [Ceratobasidium sp. 423]|nr:hypothetical protein FRC11_004204 [Ceratobasidium sp. 423]